jgi:putative oxidoreductase
MLDRIRPMTLVRIAVAAVFFIHGAYRLATGGYLPFGEWLGSIGFPAGVVWAVAVTAIEVLGAPLLAAGRFVAPLAGYFIFQTALGLWLVHMPHGWFVVGAGRNGMEYSVLLIALLAAVLLESRKR